MKTKSILIIALGIIITTSCNKETVEPNSPAPLPPTTTPNPTTADSTLNFKFAINSTVTRVEFDSLVIHKLDDITFLPIDSMTVLRSEINGLATGTGGIVFSALDITVANPMDVSDGDKLKLYLHLNTTNDHTGEFSRFELGHNGTQTPSDWMTWAISPENGLGVISAYDVYYD